MANTATIGNLLDKYRDIYIPICWHLYKTTVTNINLSESFSLYPDVTDEMQMGVVINAERAIRIDTEHSYTYYSPKVVSIFMNLYAVPIFSQALGRNAHISRKDFETLKYFHTKLLERKEEALKTEDSYFTHEELNQPNLDDGGTSKYNPIYRPI